MTQAAKAQEPSMEEILASIRRIIADDDGVKPLTRPEARAPEVEAPEPRPVKVPPPPRQAVPPPMPPMPEQPIISSATAAAVDSAFNALAHTVLVQNAKTLEDLVKEMLRPMLQHWLDNNLPTLVERLVRAEIERVARGRG